MNAKENTKDNTKMVQIKNAIGTICGAIACVSVFFAISVTNDSEHEMAVRLGGIIGFAVFAMLWSALKGGDE